MTYQTREAVQSALAATLRHARIIGDEIGLPPALAARGYTARQMQRLRAVAACRAARVFSAPVLKRAGMRRGAVMRWSAEIDDKCKEDPAFAAAFKDFVQSIDRALYAPRGRPKPETFLER